MRGYFSKGDFMEKKAILVQLFAIVCLTILEMSAILTNQNGNTLYYVVVAIGAIAGIQIYKQTANK